MNSSMEQSMFLDNEFNILGIRRATELLFERNQNSQTMADGNFTVKDTNGTPLLTCSGDLASNTKVIRNPSGQEVVAMEKRLMFNKFDFCQDGKVKGRMRLSLRSSDIQNIHTKNLKGKFETIEGVWVDIYVTGSFGDTKILLGGSGKDGSVIARTRRCRKAKYGSLFKRNASKRQDYVCQIFAEVDVPFIVALLVAFDTANAKVVD